MPTEIDQLETLTSTTVKYVSSQIIAFSFKIILVDRAYFIFEHQAF